jgi:hypothetical protein
MNGGDEPNQGILWALYGNVTMKLPVQLIYANRIFF